MKNWKTKIALILTAGLLSAAGAVTALAASRTRLDTVSDVYWGDDGTTANWDAVDDAYQYEIRLFSRTPYPVAHIAKRTCVYPFVSKKIIWKDILILYSFHQSDTPS